MATNSKQLVIDFGFDSKASSNIAGTLNVQGDIISSGTFTFGSSGNLIPDTASTRFLGNSTFRWITNSTTIDATGAVTVSNTISTGNSTVTGFINVSSTANVGGAVDLRNTLTVNGATTIANTLAVGDTTITGFANVSSTANVGGAVNLRSTLTVNGAATIANTLAVGNTTITGILSTGNTTITGFANVTSTIQGGSGLTIAGPASGITTLAAGNTTITGFANVTSTLSTGNTTITGFANVSTSVNSSLFTIGTTLVANTNGIHHSGYVNAASFVTTGGGIVANTTAISPTSNSVLLGNSIGRFVLSANTGNFSGAVTISGNATLSGALQTISGNVAFDTQVLFVDSVNNRVGINSSAPTVALEVIGAANVSTSVNSSLFTIGTTLVANTNGIYHTGTVNAASFSTSGFVANTTAIAPTSNTILLGNSIGRFVLSANTGDFSGAVSGLSFSTSGFVANTISIAPTSNTILLGNTIGRFVLSANTGDFSGVVNAASFTATGLVANSAGVFHTGTIEAAIFNSTSDANSKYNIKTIEDPISKVMNMRGVTFTWKHSDKPSMGLIAQEVEPIIPEVVNTDDNGKKSVSYDNIIGLLIEAIKHQQLQINSLTAKMVARDGD